MMPSTVFVSVLCSVFIAGPVSSSYSLCRNSTLSSQYLCNCSNSQEKDIFEERRIEATNFLCRCPIAIEGVDISSKNEIEPRDLTGLTTQPYQLRFPEHTQQIKIEDCKFVSYTSETLLDNLNHLEINNAEKVEIKEYLPKALDKLIISGRDETKTVFTLDENQGGYLYGEDNEKAELQFVNVKFPSESDELFTELHAKSFTIDKSSFESISSKETTLLGEMTLEAWTIKNSDIHSIFDLGLLKSHVIKKIQFSNNQIHSTCKPSNEFEHEGLDNHCFIYLHIIQNDTFRGNKVRCSCMNDTSDCVNGDRAVTQFGAGCSDVVLKNTHCLEFPEVSLFQLKESNITESCEDFEAAVLNMPKDFKDSCLGCSKETKITKNEEKLAKFAVNHPEFLPGLAGPDSVCGEQIIPKILAAKTQVVAGTNYIMQLRFLIEHGQNCDQRTVAVCSNVVLHRPLPHVCKENEDSSGCLQLIKKESINCTFTNNDGVHAKKTFQNSSLLTSGMNTGSMFGLILFLIGSVFLLVLIVMVKRFPPKPEEHTEDTMEKSVPKDEEDAKSKTGEVNSTPDDQPGQDVQVQEETQVKTA
eukprot:GFUD01014653.1.p1 GENE.GFUD01014653.1~~GFUD01014653.1.p1  ORF type:complete len:585 (-),score=159.05 GFUD01014653.1:91-1845(-)